MALTKYFIKGEPNKYMTYIFIPFLNDAAVYINHYVYVSVRYQVVS